MRIEINGAAQEVLSVTVAELCAELRWPERGVAVAVGGRIVKRDKWAECTLEEGMRLTVFKAAQGG